MTDDTRFVVLSMPRSGSTTLARLLNCHARIRCLHEPFHPHRFGGRFHAFAVHRSVHETLAVIWEKWNAIKHVWDLEGFPFAERAELNDQIVTAATCKVVLVVRRNILRRIVSNHLSRQTHTWIGPRETFISRLATTAVAPLDPAVVRAHIRAESAALAAKIRFLADHHVACHRVDYEDLFSVRSTPDDQRMIVNSILSFLGFEAVEEGRFVESWLQHLDPARHQWATPDVYRRIPDIDVLEEAVGDDVTGWLFR
jgi:hypothetical protein